jgi:PAS domain S-box-containing protein
MNAVPLELGKAEPTELRAVLEHALVGVCLVDANDMRATWCNAAFYRFIGPDVRAAGGIAGRHVDAFLPNYAKHRYEAVFRLVGKTGRPFVNPEDEHAEPHGERTFWRWSLTAPQFRDAAAAPTENAPAPVLLIQAIDITAEVAARRQAAALKASEAKARLETARLEAILDSTDEGIVVADAAGTILHMNPAARRIHGYGPEDEHGRVLEDFATVFELRRPGEDQVLPLDEWPLARALRGEQFSGFELLVRRRDVEHEVIVDYSGSTVVPHDGRGNVVIVGVRDITARKHAERELERARREAEAASHAKDQFLAVLSHELRTPLTPVLTAAQAMEGDPQVPESLRATAGMIRRNVELEARLIDDLLDLTRISRGKLRLDFTRSDVHEKLLSVVQILEHDAQSKGVQLVVSLAARRRHVRADPARLQQIVWNLLKNAIKFTPEAGRITIATSETGDGQILIEVLDTGIGIQPEVLPRIFDAFQQGSGDVTKQFGGLGLGLAITKVLVQLHGGTITAESAGPGRGSRFSVQLPLVAEPSRKAGGGGAPVGGSGLSYSSSSGLAHIVGSGLANVAGGGADRDVPDYIGNSSGLAATAERAVAAKRDRRRILLVEDHEDTAMIMSSVLRHQGHVVRRAATVAGALQAAQAEPFDLIISDIGLPDGSGLDLMRQLRLRQPVRGIALSGFGMEDDIRRSRDAGFDEHLTKPVSLEVLESTLRRVVDA